MTNEELVQQIRAGDAGATVTLWNQVERFAYKQASIYFYGLHGEYRADLEDLRQSSYIAFAEALENYGPEKGANFLTYFYYHLRNEFLKAAGLKKRDAMARAGSLDAPVADEEAGQIEIDLLEDPAAQEAFESAEDRIYTEQLHEALEKALEKLDPGSAEVIRQIYYEGKTTGDLAELLQLDVKEIKTAKRRGMTRLQRSDCRKPLAGFIELSTPWGWHRGEHVTEDIVIRREALAWLFPGMQI